MLLRCSTAILYLERNSLFLLDFGVQNLPFDSTCCVNCTPEACMAALSCCRIKSFPISDSADSGWVINEVSNNFTNLSDSFLVVYHEDPRSFTDFSRVVVIRTITTENILFFYISLV